MSRPSGFSLVELLVALGLALSILGSALTIVGRMQTGMASEGERADMQQRLRVASDALLRDLAMAGAGPYQGAYQGPLNAFIATVMPFRQGAIKADPPGVFKRDTLSIIYVPPRSAAQTTIRQAMTAQSGVVAINVDPGCPPGDANCAFVTGMDVMIFDETGAYDTFRVLSTEPGLVQLQHNMEDSPHVYPAGSKIAAAASHTYYLKVDASGDNSQLMHYDGVSSDAAVVDHVVSLGVQYFGEPFPPRLVKPPTDPTGPWTTYGPRPPPPDVQPTQYPSGENCVFRVDPTAPQPVPRLPVLGDGRSTTLVELDAASLTDGPWCPDAASTRRYDADLLRIRKLVITMRIESQAAALRGPAGTLFVRGGTSHDVNRWVPDQEFRLEVTPRNLGVGR